MVDDRHLVRPPVRRKWECGHVQSHHAAPALDVGRVDGAVPPPALTTTRANRATPPSAGYPEGGGKTHVRDRADRGMEGASPCRSLLAAAMGLGASTALASARPQPDPLPSAEAVSEDRPGDPAIPIRSPRGASVRGMGPVPVCSAGPSSFWTGCSRTGSAMQLGTRVDEVVQFGLDRTCRAGKAWQGR